MASKSLNNQLIAYARKGNLSGVKQALLEGAGRRNEGDTALITAASLDHHKIVEFLLDKGSADYLSSTAERRSALTHAANNGCHKSVKVLLEGGAWVDSQDEVGKSALIIASSKGDIKTVKLLLKYGSQLDFQDSRGWTALMWAVWRGSNKVSKVLLKHGAHSGAQVNLQNEHGNSALMIASEKGSADVVQKLLEHGAEVSLKNSHENTALSLAIQSNSMKTVEALLDSGAKVDYQQSLIAACKIGFSDVVKLLLDRSELDLKDEHGRIALTVAIENGNVEVVQVLLKSGAIVNALDDQGRSPLIFAVTRDVEHASLWVAQSLLENGAQIDYQCDDGKSALVVASEIGNLESVQFLIAHGANLNLPDKHGRTALTAAIEKEHFRVVQFLLEGGAKVDSSSSMLKLAVSTGNVKILKLLLKYDRHLNTGSQDESGKNAVLMLASENGFEEGVSLLLDGGVQVNYLQDDGKSALIVASENKHFEAMELLADNGAQVNLKDSNGRTALSYASEIFNHETWCSNLPEPTHQTIQEVLQRQRHGATYPVEYLLQMHADVNLPDMYGRSPLMFASEKGNQTSVEILLRYGARVNLQDKKGKSALMRLLCLDADMIKSDVFIKLIEFGSNVNLQDEEGNSAVMLACRNKYIPSIHTMLDYRAKLDLQDKAGWSALMRAVESGGILKVEELVRRSASLNLRNNAGLTPLMIASQNGYSEILKILTNGAEYIDSRDNGGRSALMHASEHGHVQIVKQLIKCGGCIDLQDNQGRSPLMIACQNGHAGLASMLLDSGANSYLKNEERKTAFDIALSSSYPKILDEFTKLRTEPSFPGILFSERGKRELLTTSEKDITLKEVGISLSIPKDALSSTDPPLEVQIQPCFSGSWELPENLEIVSPAYIVKPSREVVFRRDILIKIWHHANLETEEDCEDMVFLSASTIPEYRGESPVYVFREITGVKGSFRPREEQPAGKIALKHFCILSLGRFKRKRGN